MTGIEAAQAYVVGVSTGQIVAGRLVQLAVQRHLRDVETGKARGLYFDDAEANAALWFIGHLRHSKGRWAGLPFELEPWQAFVVASLFGWRRKVDGFRRFRTAYVETARKQGKSTLAAGIGLYLFVGDGEPGSEVYCAAVKRDQARIVHGEAIRMVQKSLGLRRVIAQRLDNLSYVPGACKMEPLGADANSMDGLNVHGAIVDEIHKHRTREIWDILETATGAREQPLMLGITTAGATQVGICWELHDAVRKMLEGITPDDRLFGFIAAPDPEDDWKTEPAWEKANPSLDVTVKREDLRAELQSVLNRPSAQNTFRRYRCNQWVRQQTRFLDLDRWDACKREIDLNALRGQLCYGGLDLSARTDLTALALLFPQEDHFEAFTWHWIPEDRIADLEDQTGAPLGHWVDKGWLEATEGDVVDLEHVRARVLELAEQYEIAEIGFDRFGALWLYPQLEHAGLTMVALGQGPVTMNAPLRELEVRVLRETLHHDGNPVLRWEADCLETKRDSQDNLKPAKPDRKSASARIDGMVALIMALERATRSEPPKASRYETHEAQVW